MIIVGGNYRVWGGVVSIEGWKERAQPSELMEIGGIIFPREENVLPRSTLVTVLHYLRKFCTVLTQSGG